MPVHVPYRTRNQTDFEENIHLLFRTKSLWCLWFSPISYLLNNFKPNNNCILNYLSKIEVKVEEKLLDKNYKNSRKGFFHLVSLRKHVVMNNEWLSEIKPVCYNNWIDSCMQQNCLPPAGKIMTSILLYSMFFYLSPSMKV